MPGKTRSLPYRVRAWFRSRALRARPKKARQRLQAAVLMPTLALFAALGILLNDSFFEDTLSPSPSPMLPAVVATVAALPTETRAERTTPTPSPIPTKTAPPTGTQTESASTTVSHSQEETASPPPSLLTPTEADRLGEPGEIHVWIPQSGTRYHKTAECSGMKDPIEVSLREAKEQGFTPCKRCNPPE